MIKWIRKIVSRSMERANADVGVKQFVDSMLKFVMYAVLIFLIATKFGVESSSVAALIASAGVAIGLAVQGSLSNFAGGILILILKYYGQFSRDRRNSEVNPDFLYKNDDDRQQDDHCSKWDSDR